MRTLAVVVKLTVIGLASTSALAGDNLFQNPSFELGAFSPNGDNTTVVNVGATAITGWQVVGAQIAWIDMPNPFSLTPSEGTRFLDLTGYPGGFGGVAQTIPTSPGTLYQVQFDQGSGVFGSSFLRALASDSQGTFQSVDFTEVGIATSRWNSHSFDFVARETSTTITFGHLFGTGNYTGLDNVALFAMSAPCIGDYDQDGGITGADVSAFFADFEMGEPAADVDLDGGITPGDLALFFQRYESGC